MNQELKDLLELCKTALLNAKGTYRALKSLGMEREFPGIDGCEARRKEALDKVEDYLNREFKKRKQMKKQEFIEKLKCIAKENGFEIRNESAEDYDLFSVAEKDIWEGVDFAEFITLISRSFTFGKIYKIKGSYAIDDKIERHGFDELWLKTNFQPSTEAAYEEQLKRIAKEKFGEIKEGDRFDRSWLKDGINTAVFIGKDQFSYRKFDDTLSFCGLEIYQQGKWATKIHTPSVLFRENDSSYSSNPVFTFHVRNFKIDYINGPEIGRHLANEFQNFIQNKQNNEKQQ